MQKFDWILNCYMWPDQTNGECNSGNGALGQTALREMLVGKIRLRQHGQIWSLRSQYIYVLFFGIKPLWSAWVADTVSFWCVQTSAFTLSPTPMCLISLYILDLAVKTACGKRCWARGFGTQTHVILNDLKCKNWAEPSKNSHLQLQYGGQAVVQLVETLPYKLEGRGVRFPMVSLEFFIDIILGSTQEYFLGGGEG
jgi:hypothetical protein